MITERPNCRVGMAGGRWQVCGVATAKPLATSHPLKGTDQFSTTCTCPTGGNFTTFRALL